ncbi:hypothetical protein [Streptomyces sp. NPDC015350]|uniref:hypothetical protein n=1 Tax=Streptomyces sp. NPDC015350 TaxID=3364955 RepID=UPI0036FBBA7F
MKTSAPTFRPGPQRQKSGCPHADRVSGMETPMITELVAAMFHLEGLLETVGTPDQELAAHPVPISPERHRKYVLDAADRIRRALDELTAPYGTPVDTSTTTTDEPAP